MAHVSDHLILPKVEKLHTCVCDTLTAKGLDAACKCMMLPGSVFPPSEPAPGHGVAWVGVSRIYPSSSFGVQAAPADVKCRTGLTAELNIGVIRCMAITKDGPTPDQSAEYMDKMLADMQALREAVLCCDHGIEDIGLGDWTPYGPIGGVFGGYWTVEVSA